MPLFVKMFKNLDIYSVGLIKTNGNKVLGTCVFWHVNCFYCMSIKLFNAIEMFYGLFVKDIVSYGFIWDDIEEKCVDLNASTSNVLELFEYCYEGHVHEYTPLLDVATLFGGCCGFNPFYRPMILNWFVFTIVGTQGRDLRTNSFQGEEDDMTTYAGH